MKRCKKCGEAAAIHLASHGVSFCAEHLLEFVRKKVKKIIGKYKLLNPHERVAVALSGGKDSAVLLHVLDFLYAETLELIGIHIDLGIETAEYSKKSRQLAEELCHSLGREFYCVEMKNEYQVSMDMVKARERRVARPLCAVCGTFKRYVLNRKSIELGCEKLATGHVLDDEVSVLLMNLFSGNVEQLIRMGPKLSGRGKTMIARVKPLFEIYELETTLYAQFMELGFLDVECPYSQGASTSKYKRILQTFEEQFSGIEISVLQNFLKRIFPPLKEYYAKAEDDVVNTCIKCNGPTISEVCAFCNLRNLTLKEK